MSKLNRRKFIKTSSLSIIGAGLLKKSYLSLDRNELKDEIPRINKFNLLGRTGFRASDIGCGNTSEEAILKSLIEKGVNYIDTSERYNNGRSEIAIGKAIKEFDRKSLFITTKVHPPLDKYEGVLARARKCLGRLDTGYIDCLMIQNADSVELVKNKAFHATVSQLKSEGSLRFCGIACHGAGWQNVPNNSMEEIMMAAIEDGRFDVLLLVYNFIQQDMSKRILKACKENNIGTVIMKANPVFRYERILNKIQELESEEEKTPRMEGQLWFLKSFLDKMKVQSDQTKSFVENQRIFSNDKFMRDIAIQFVLSNPDVNTVLLNFMNFEYVESYLKLSGTTLNTAEKKMLAQYNKIYGRLYCRHACGACESSCPSKIPINTIMRYNHYFVAQGQEKYAMSKYANLPGPKASLCRDCPGYCQDACPYSVPIHSLLNIAHHNLMLLS